MPYQHATAFGTTYGNLTDDERLRASQGMNQAQIAAQMAALQAEINDRQAGRVFEGGENAANRAQQGSEFDKTQAQKLTLDQSATQRAFGLADREMLPATMGAQLERDKYNDTADQRAFKAQIFRGLTGVGGPFNPVADSSGGDPASMPGGSPASGMTPSRFGGMDPDAMMFMAMGGNPGDYMMQKRQETAMNLNRQDAQDARSVDIAKAFLASDKPEARALGAQLLSRVKNIGLSGTDASTLQTALQPEADPVSLVSKSPSLRLAMDNAKTLMVKATQVGGDPSMIDQAKIILTGLAKDMISKGAKPDDAQAFITNELKGVLPANDTAQGDFIRNVMSLLPSVGPSAALLSGITGPARDRTTTARQVAGIPY